MSGQDSRLRGRWGEDQAAAYLRDKGYHITAANWKCRFGELDLVAEDGAYLCFVEVKLRKSAAYGSAAEFVDKRKQARLRSAAELYLLQHPTRLQPRFDVIEIYAPQGTETKKPEIIYLDNAF
ncbi:MAG: YraN family protein [Lawsonibacter sp.]|nr:YraN family protein [Lawsonibacter sp.]